MTAIAPTEPEPLCDVAAQIRALLDPAHPKRAVWISDGTEFVMIDVPRGLDLACLDLEGHGTLYASAHDCGRLADDPSEEILAELLGYSEPKGRIIAEGSVDYPVVQARDKEGCVVWEQVASWSRAGEAAARARLYGRAKILTMDDVLRRRARLVAEEKADAQRLQGCAGRE